MVFSIPRDNFLELSGNTLYEYIEECCCRLPVGLQRVALYIDPCTDDVCFQSVPFEKGCSREEAIRWLCSMFGVTPPLKDELKIMVEHIPILEETVTELKGIEALRKYLPDTGIIYLPSE